MLRSALSANHWRSGLLRMALRKALALDRRTDQKGVCADALEKETRSRVGASPLADMGAPEAPGDRKGGRAMSDREYDFASLVAGRLGCRTCHGYLLFFAHPKTPSRSRQHQVTKYGPMSTVESTEFVSQVFALSGRRCLISGARNAR